MKSLLCLAVVLLAAQTFAAQTSPQRGEKKETIRSITVPDKSQSIVTDAKTEPVVSSQARQNGYVRPGRDARFKRYVKSMFGPVSLGTTVVNAGYSTWRNSPEEWGPAWEGFGRRVASSMGKKAIKQTTIYALDESLKVDSQFYRSTNKSVGARLRNALISPVATRKPNGKRVFGFPRIAGTYASSIISAETWYPDRYSYKNGLKSGTISLGFNAAFNVFKEFVWTK